MAAIYIGATDGTALRLALAMVALQASIGIVNDIVDAPRDAGRVPPKPIPAGLVGVRPAQGMAVLAAALGLGLSSVSGGGLVAIAIVVLAIGYGYNLVFKGTAWSWLPFAVGIPLLPVFGWVGASGTLPSGSGIVVGAAMIAGAGLAIANARADVEQDESTGTVSVATVLGLRRSWWLATSLLGGVTVLALWLLAEPPPTTSTIGLVLVAYIGAAVIALGALLGRSGSPRRRELAWECQAIGVVVLAAGYLAARGIQSGLMPPA